jgi:hypothetical protein
MAHEIETYEDQAAFVSVRENAWHQLGTVVPDALTAEDALKYALNFPAYLRESPSILQVICKPYQDLLSFPRGLKAIDMMTLQRQKRPLQDLFDIFQQKPEFSKNFIYVNVHIRGKFK